MIPLERPVMPAFFLFGSGPAPCGSYRLPDRRRQAVFDRFTGAKWPYHGSKRASIGLGKRGFMPN